MSFNNSILEEIKNRVDIVDLISEYVSLKRTGQNWKGLCPFHSEKTPSFTVSPAKQIYHCFGCGAGGDIFTFLVQYENLSFQEALGTLAKRAGITLDRSRSGAKKGEREILLNLHRDALAFYQGCLARYQTAMDYLKERGVDSKTLAAFSLGYAPKSWDSLYSHLKRKGYEAEIIHKAGLITKGSKGYYDTFRHRIIFPIFDLKGDIVAFGGRALDDSTPKYLNSPETPIFNKRKVLYGLNIARDSIRKSEQVLFMEGYFDVITAHMHGFSNTVAPLGTAITPEHGRLIKRFTGDVILLFDSDQAGIKAAKNAAGLLLESGLNVSILSFPSGEDPDSFLRRNGREAFEGLLKRPLSIIDFLILQEGEKYSIAREAVEMISRMSDRILQGHYIKLLSERLDINEFFLIEELKRMSRSYRQKQRDEVETSRQQTRPIDEIYLLKLMIQYPEKTEYILNSISEEDFQDPVTKQIFKKIRDGLRGFNELLLQCEGEEKDLLTELLFKPDFENPEKALTDCVNRMKAKRRQALLQSLQHRIREAELRGDGVLLKSLLEQYRSIRSGGG